MSDKPKVHRHIIIYGLGGLALQVTNAALLLLYTNYLDTAEYGVLQMIFRIGEVIHICLMAQTVKLATFNLVGSAPDKEACENTAASVATITFSAILIGSTLIVVIGPWLVYHFPAIGESRLLICGVLTVMLQALTVMPIAMMQSRFESTTFVLATMSMAICHILMVGSAIVIFGWGVWGVIFSLALTYLTFGILLTLRELRSSSFRPDIRQIRNFIHFAAPIVPVGFISMAMHNGDQFFLMSSHGAAAVGVYVLGYRITQALGMFATDPLMQVWHPWMYKVYKRDNGPDLLGKAATGILSVYLFLGLGLLIFRNELIRTLSSEGYWGASELLVPLVIAFFFYGRQQPGRRLILFD